MLILKRSKTTKKNNNLVSPAKRAVVNPAFFAGNISFNISFPITPYNAAQFISCSTLFVSYLTNQADPSTICAGTFRIR
jgi:hypothetical protein